MPRLGRGGQRMVRIARPSALVVLAVLSAACGMTESDAQSRHDAGASPDAGDAQVADAVVGDAQSETGPVDASEAASVCHDVTNVAPTVRALEIDGPFPQGVGLGGSFSSGTYHLTQVVYYTGADAASPLPPKPIDVWWRTTIELNVTLGTLADRTWHIGNTPDLTDKPEHRETLLVEPQSGSTLALSSQCSDWPVSLTAEYSANETEFRLWYPGVRYEVYSKQP